MTEDVYQSRAKLATRPRQQSHWNPHPTRSEHAVLRSRARDATASGPPGAPEGVNAGEREEVPGHATFRRPYADQTRIPSLDSRLVDQPDITPIFEFCPVGRLYGAEDIDPFEPLGERIALNASLEATMGAWLTISRGFVTMPVMQILTSTITNIFPDAKTDTR
jgi:hypothetical protein